jgi:hypothetical protein
MNMEFIYIKPALKMPACEEIVPKKGRPTLLSREEVHFCEVSRRRTGLVSLLAHHFSFADTCRTPLRIPGTKNPATEEMAGQVPNSRFLFPEEEVRERLRIRASHAGHVIPALLCVKAVIGAE